MEYTTFPANSRVIASLAIFRRESVPSPSGVRCKPSIRSHEYLRRNAVAVRANTRMFLSLLDLSENGYVFVHYGIRGSISDNKLVYDIFQQVCIDQPFHLYILILCILRCTIQLSISPQILKNDSVIAWWIIYPLGLHRVHNLSICIGLIHYSPGHWPLGKLSITTIIAFWYLEWTYISCSYDRLSVAIILFDHRKQRR